MNFIPKQIEPTYFPDGYGVRATKNKEVVIIDFFQAQDNNKTIISSIALPKSAVNDLIKQIKNLLGDENV